MNAEQIVAEAKAHGWKRREVKQACYTHGVSLADRERVYAELGMAATAEPQPADSVAAVKMPRLENVEGKSLDAVLGRAGRRPVGNMVLKFPATDRLTGRALEPGTVVVGVKVGGAWDFTAELMDAGEFRRLVEAVLLTNDPDEGGPNGSLGADDHRLLADFGTRYPHLRASIACAVPGLEG